MGTRSRSAWFVVDHVACVGASKPGTIRRYEFTHWLVTSIVSGAWPIRPAMKLRASALRPSASSASVKALSSPRNSESWRCMPEPLTSRSGFGMNVAYAPWRIATSFTTRRYVMIASAIVSASV